MPKYSSTRIASIQDQLESQRQRILGPNPTDVEPAAEPPADAGSPTGNSNRSKPASEFPHSVTVRLMLSNPDLVVWVACVLARRIGISPQVNAKFLEQAFGRFSHALCCLINATKIDNKDVRDAARRDEPVKPA